MNPTSFFPDEELPITPVADRPEPPLWVRRIVIVAARVPDAEVIREITLRPGLNVVRVVDRPAGETRPVGHSVGKTLLMRLIRYCLGESHFAAPTVLRRIVEVLPDAYVLAEITVASQAWVVARPLRDAHSGASYAIPAGDWQAGLGEVSGLQRFGDYLARLALTTIEPLAPLYLPNAGRSARWLDLLAWLARDQECSYHHDNEWRDPDASSGTARLHRDDASLLMRWAMGFLGGDEIALRAKHQRLLDDRAEASSEVERLTASVAMAQPSLRNRLGLEGDGLPEEFFTQQVRQAADLQVQALERLRNDVGDDTSLALLHDEAVRAAQVLAVAENELVRLQAYRQQAKGEIRERRQSSGPDYLAKFDPNRNCPLSLERCPRHPSNQTDSVSDPEREEKIAELEESLWIDQVQIARLEHQDLPKLREQRLQAEQRYAQERRRRESSLSGIQAQMGRWELLREEVVEYERDRQRLQGAENRLARLEREVRQSLERQGAAREEHERRHKALSSYFDWTLKKLLGRDAGGTVLLDARGLHPDPGPSVAASGAAIATLSTVLGLDLACLTASLCGLGHLPSLLIHDSPKEADMESVLYDRLFTLALDLERAYPGRQPAFQYIVTTTTPPPAHVSKPYTRLTLDAREPGGLLLGRRF